MKRMMEKGKGKRRTQTKCRANKGRKVAAQSTREAEETNCGRVSDEKDDGKGERGIEVEAFSI